MSSLLIQEVNELVWKVSSWVRLLLLLMDHQKFLEKQGVLFKATTILRFINIHNFESIKTSKV